MYILFKEQIFLEYIVLGADKLGLKFSSVSNMFQSIKNKIISFRVTKIFYIEDLLTIWGGAYMKIKTKIDNSQSRLYILH